MFNEDTYTIPNWDLNPALESEVYLSQGIYDALNRPIIQRTGRTGKAMSSVDYTYNEAGLLESVKANSSQKGLKDYVKSIDYNEKGQRKTIVYGNNTKTSYSYDKNTFRLAQIRTLNGIDKVQDLNYTYDPVGNISTVVNLAEDTIFFKNQNVEPSNSYVYDAIYRLTQATGREHIGQAGVHANTPDSQTDIFRINLPHPGNGTALQNYKQNYNYGPTGNMQMMRHVAGLGNLTHRWTKTFGYNNNDHDRQQLGVPLATKKNNQLLEYKQGTNSQQYDFDLHGNMQSIQPNTASEKFDLSWNCFDQLKHINILAGTAHYWYDASGERSRKVLTDGTNITRERIYFFGLEVYREYHSNKTVKLERESFHIHDDTGRIALVDTKTIDHPSDDTQEQLIRYQYSNHIGSSSLELDAVGRIISYEEYYPYGTTSYQAVNQTIKSAAKRYRYTGMERDDESGLNYHSARYYLPWLCRWANPDPIGIGDGVNLFRYCDNTPIMNTDKKGKQSETSVEDQESPVQLTPFLTAISPLSLSGNFQINNPFSSNRSVSGHGNLSLGIRSSFSLGVPSLDLNTSGFALGTGNASVDTDAGVANLNLEGGAVLGDLSSINIALYGRASLEIPVPSEIPISDAVSTLGAEIPEASGDLRLFGSVRASSFTLGDFRARASVDSGTFNGSLDITALGNGDIGRLHLNATGTFDVNSGVEFNANGRLNLLGLPQLNLEGSGTVSENSATFQGSFSGGGPLYSSYIFGDFDLSTESGVSGRAGILGLTYTPGVSIEDPAPLSPSAMAILGNPSDPWTPSGLTIGASFFQYNQGNLSWISAGVIPDLSSNLFTNFRFGITAQGHF